MRTIFDFIRAVRDGSSGGFQEHSMRVILSFVPPGGGEQVACNVAELPGFPSPGDYVSLSSPEADGQANFIVRRTWWRLDAGGKRLPAKTEAICIECEIAEGPFQSES